MWLWINVRDESRWDEIPDDGEEGNPSLTSFVFNS